MSYVKVQCRADELSPLSFVDAARKLSDIEEMKSRGDRVKFIREVVLGLKSQAQLADKMGVSRVAVTNWEKGDGIRLDHLKELARLGKTTVSWIEEEKGEPPSDRFNGDSQVSASLNEESVVGLIEGILSAFDLPDSHVPALGTKLCKSLAIVPTGKTPDEIRSGRKTVGEFLTREYLLSKRQKDG